MKLSRKHNKNYAFHARSAVLLDFAEDSLFQVLSAIEARYGRSSFEWKQLDSAIKKLGRARSRLDDRLGREFHGIDAEELNRFYYGKD